MEISSLSNWDYVNLVGHYIRIRDGDTIDPALYDRGFTEAQIKAMQEKLNKSPASTKAANLMFSGDLSRFNYSMFDFVVNTYRAYRDHGNMPFEGTISDQPNQIIEIYNVLDQLRFEVEERERKKAEADQKRLRARKK